MYLAYAVVALLVGITSSVFLWWSVRPQFPYEPKGGLLFVQVMKHAPEALTSRAPLLERHRSSINLLALRDTRQSILGWHCYIRYIRHRIRRCHQNQNNHER